MGYVDIKRVIEAAKRQGIPLEDIKKGKYYFETLSGRLVPSPWYGLKEKYGNKKRK